MTTDDKGGFGIDEVMRRLPHRYPMLMVDRVLECVPGERLVALKNVTANEEFFAGHFPGRPVMPGVLMLEALAQAAGILCFVTAGIYPDENVKFYFAGIDKARFRRPVIPGDRLDLNVQVIHHRTNVWKLRGEASVEGTLCAQGELLASVVDRNG